MLLRVMGKISALGYDACLTCIISTEGHSGTPPVVGEIEYRQESMSGGQNSIREPLQDSSVGIARSRFDCLIVPALRANSVITARNPDLGIRERHWEVKPSVLSDSAVSAHQKSFSPQIYHQKPESTACTNASRYSHIQSDSRKPR